jgi:hypothetical protein
MKVLGSSQETHLEPKEIEVPENCYGSVTPELISNEDRKSNAASKFADASRFDLGKQAARIHDFLTLS